MKSTGKFIATLALGMGLLGTAATAQNAQLGNSQDVRAEYATFDPGQSGLLHQVDAHRRCDGDHDRDDRGCYYRDYRYQGYVGYGNGYVYATPYYAPPAGWYDRDGRWHAYHRDRDKDRRRHHDDDDRR